MDKIMFKHILKSTLYAFFTLSLGLTGSYASVKRIAVIDSQAGEPYNTIRRGLYKHLKNYGYEKNLNLDVKEFSIGNFSGAVKNIWSFVLKNKVDLVYVSGTMATIGAKKYLLNQEIPVVFAAPTDPVGIGVITSFTDKPAYNFTGVCYPVKVENRIRFMKKIIPNLKSFAYIYANMPQSISYLGWLREALKKEEFKGITMIAREVPFVPTEKGQIRMASFTIKHIKELNSKVDVFLSPNDQMGTQSAFAKTVIEHAKKPLIGVGRKDVVNNWGASASIYSSLDDISDKAAKMISQILNGKEIGNIYPEWPSEGIAIDINKSKKFNLLTPKMLILQAKQSNSLVE
jgi:putative ABC transport system substrate-binding protein